MYPFKKLTELAGLLILMFCIPTSHASVMDIHSEETIAVIKKGFAMSDGLSKSVNLSPLSSGAFGASTSVASEERPASKSFVLASGSGFARLAAISFALLSIGGVALGIGCRQAIRKLAFS